MVNELIVKNFNENIEYLESLHNGLFSKIAALDSAIANGHYKEKYDLVYENDNFDVLEKDTNTYLYSKSSLAHAQLALKSINYNLEENAFKTFDDYEVSNDDLETYKEKPLFEHHISGFGPIINYVQNNSVKNKTLSTLDKFIFFGVGLGIHIDEIAKSILSKVYFIIEDDLELFRLSLFTINYASLARNSELVFSVFEDNEEFRRSANDFLAKQSYYNHYIKHFGLLSHSEEKLNQFHLCLTSQAHLAFYYNSFLKQYLKPLDYLFDEYKYLNKGASFSNNKFDDKPFLLVAAGPSLDKNREFLSKHHKKFVIVTITATLEYLYEQSISPDIIIHLDPYETSMELLDGLESMDFIKDSICFFTDKISSNVIKKFNKENVFLFENGTKYKDNSLKPSASCVGSITYQILLALKVKNLYLLGLDLALDSKTGKTHTSSYVGAKNVSIEEGVEHKDLMNYADSLFAIEGNSSKEVLTNPRWKTSIDTINLSTRQLKQKSQNIFNLSDGAKFIDVQNKKFSEVELEKLQELKGIKKGLYSLFLDNSSSVLSDSEKKNLNNKLMHARKLLEMVEKYDIDASKTLDKSIEKLLNIRKELTKEEDINMYELSRVLDSYLRYILSYIFDFLNSTTLENKEIHFNNLCLILIEHILQIINYYCEFVGRKLNDI